MDRIKNTRELKRRLEDVELLEAIYYQIDRSETKSKKNSALAKFSKEAKSQIEEQRDVILISIKVK